jgi:glutaredoxin
MVEMYRLDAFIDKQDVVNLSFGCIESMQLLVNPEGSIMSEALFFHAGCPVCVSAEQHFIQALDPTRYAVESVHLGEQKDRIAQAERYGVMSVPALVIDGQPFHINFGAALADLK